MQHQNNTNRPRQSRFQLEPAPRSHKKIWIGVAIVVVLFFGAKIIHPQKSAAEAPTPARSAAAQQTAINAMNNAVQTVLTNNPTVDISATIIDTKTGTTNNYGPDVAYEAASVAKLITATELLHRVENNELTLSTKLDNNDTASTALRKMVVNSDNAAWGSLNDEMSLAKLQQYARSIGITDYNLDNNSLTTKDIGLLLQKLYAGKLLNTAHTNLLLGYMAKANEADLIPPVVPHGVKMYHKAGLLDDRVHDSAIIDDGKNPIIVVVFTNGHGTYSFPARTEAIQTITRAALSAYEIQ